MLKSIEGAKARQASVYLSLSPFPPPKTPQRSLRALSPPAMFSSATSSCSSSNSLFSNVSASTAHTSQSVHQPVDDARRSTIHLPTKLPAAPVRAPDVDLSKVIVDKEFEGLPLGLVVAKLHSMGVYFPLLSPSSSADSVTSAGADLLRACSATAVHSPAGPSLPPYLPCTLLSTPSRTSSLPPTHVLRPTRPVPSSSQPTACFGRQSAPGSPSSPPPPLSNHSPPSSPRPLHQISPPSPSSSSPSRRARRSPSSSMDLPRLAVDPPLLPPPRASTHHSPPLVTQQDPQPPNTARPVLDAPRRDGPPAVEPPSSTLLARVTLVHGLWQNTVALEISDEALWRTMGVAWSALVAALAPKEQRRLARVARA